MELQAGTIIAGRYRLDRELGSGGAGVVWSATHRVTGKRVALKLIGAPLHRRGAVRRRLELEARAAASLDHPYVVDVIDVFSLDDATNVLVMELLEGQTLRERFEDEGIFELEDAARLVLPAILAVGAAHARGVAHRDLKPENLFVVQGKDGREITKVLDFGIAKLLDEGADSMTRTGVAIGTPAYMAPEQGEAVDDLDHRVDVWALGVILYEALSGGRPVEGRNLREISKRLQEDGIPPLSVVAPDVPEDVAALIDGMLAREPDERQQDLQEIAERLAEHTDIPLLPFEAPGEGEPLSLPEEDIDLSSQDGEKGSASARPATSEELASKQEAATGGDEHHTLEEEGVRVDDVAAGTRSGRSWMIGVGAVAAIAVGAFAFSGSGSRGGETDGELASDGPPAETAKAAESSATPEEPTLSATPEEPPPSSTATVEPTASAAEEPPPPRPRPRQGQPVVRPVPVAPKTTAAPAAPPPPPPEVEPPPATPPPTPAGTPGLVEDPPF